MGLGEERNTQRSFLEKLQTGAIVTVIAVLVWLYAEGEAVQERPKQVEIRFVASGSQVGIEPAGSEWINVTFQASTGQMAQVEYLLAQGPVQIPVTLRENGASDQQTVVLREALEQSPLGELGVNIRDTNPATMNVSVEPLVTVTLDVAAQFAQPEMVAPRPRVEPSQVELTVAGSLAPQAEGLRAIARLDDLTAFEPDEEHTVNVRVTLPEALRHRWSRVEPASVAVTFTLRDQTDTVTLTSVPVEVSMLPVLGRRYWVDVPDEYRVLADVRLSGPSDEIDRIRRRERPIRAYVRPTADELDAGVELLNVHLDKPPSITLESPLPPVPVEITVRE